MQTENYINGKLSNFYTIKNEPLPKKGGEKDFLNNYIKKNSKF